MAKHLIVISIDAFSEDHWEAAKKLPNFSRLMRNGCCSNELKSVFPTITYAVHTTMVTGVYPDKHGIIHNHPFQPFVPEKEKNWYWYQKDVQVPTIYDLAKKNKLTTAGLLWPVTGKSSIKYNLPEVKAIKKENQVLKLLRTGNPFYCLDLELRLGRYREGFQQHQLDDYITLLTVDTIKKRKPNLMMIHLIELDNTKHHHRIDGEEVQTTLERLDKRVGEILKAVEDANIEDETVIMILGDHGHFNVDYMVHLNNLLKDKGLIYGEKGQMKWRAYLQSTGGNAYLHIKEGDTEAETIALDVLNDAMEAEQYGIEEIYGTSKLETLRGHRDIKYVVEAMVGYAFSDTIKESIVENYLEKGIKYATHGYSPEKPNYKCNFIVAGSGIKKGHYVGPMEMVDIAPTMAEILGLNFYECDGKVLEDIFENK